LNNWLHGFCYFIIPIIAKILNVGAACRRESRLQGAPTERYQKLTSGEFQKPHQIVIASCKTCAETNYQAVSYATVGLSHEFWFVIG
jgi:hypothetical protein